MNLATSHFRHRSVERAYLERLATVPEARANDNDELDETMHRVLLGLPQRQRAAIVLRFYEDLSDVQVQVDVRLDRRVLSRRRLWF